MKSAESTTILGCLTSRVELPRRDYGAQIAPGLNATSGASFNILKRLYAILPPPEKALLKTERNQIIRARYAAGETLERLASEFSISFQSLPAYKRGRPALKV